MKIHELSIVQIFSELIIWIPHSKALNIFWDQNINFYKWCIFTKEMTRKQIICPKFIRQSKSLFCIFLSLWQFIVCSCHLKPRYRTNKYETKNAINSNNHTPLLISIRMKGPRLRTHPFHQPTNNYNTKYRSTVYGSLLKLNLHMPHWTHKDEKVFMSYSTKYLEGLFL